MKKKSDGFLFGIFFVFILFMPLFGAAEPIRLKYANFLPAGTGPCTQMEKWKETVDQKTGGKVVIETFPLGTLPDVTTINVFDQVAEGKIDIGCFTPAYLPDRFIIINAASLPIKIPNARVGSLVLWEFYKKYKSVSSLENVKVLGMFTTPTVNIMSAKPVRTIHDIEGLPLRSAGGPAQILKAWGANLAEMPLTEAPEALEKGKIQGVFTSLDYMKDMNLAKYCRYVTMTDSVVFPLAVVMNLNRWNSLPPEIQKMIDDISTDHAEWTGNYVENRVKESLEWSKKTYQTEIIELSEAQRAKFEYLSTPLISEWVKNAKAKGFPASDIVMDLREFIKKYSM